MNRDIGIMFLLEKTLGPVEPVLALLTQLGDTWLLAAVAVLLYVLGDSISGWDRRRGAAVLGSGLLAVATTGLLKAAFGLPRPPGAATPAYAVSGFVGDVYIWAATADGFAFPSGHAVGAMAVYGTIAALVNRPIQPRAVLLTLVLTVVMFSRLALGVHFLVDVIAGVAVGLVLVGLSIQWAARPAVMFGAAVLMAAGWLVVSNGAPTAIGAVGICAGSLFSWTRFGDRLLAVPGQATGVEVVSALLIAGATLAAVEFGARTVAAIAGFTGMVAIVTLPLVAQEGVGDQKVSR